MGNKWVMENNNAVPDGIGGPAKNKAIVRKVREDEKDRCDNLLGYDVEMSTKKAEKWAKKWEKENPEYMLMPVKKGQVNCQDLPRDFVKDHPALDASKLPPNQNW